MISIFSYVYLLFIIFFEYLFKSFPTVFCLFICFFKLKCLFIELQEISVYPGKKNLCHIYTMWIFSPTLLFAIHLLMVLPFIFNVFFWKNFFKILIKCNLKFSFVWFVFFCVLKCLCLLQNCENFLLYFCVKFYTFSFYMKTYDLFWGYFFV